MCLCVYIYVCCVNGVCYVCMCLFVYTCVRVFECTYVRVCQDVFVGVQLFFSGLGVFVNFGRFSSFCFFLFVGCVLVLIQDFEWISGSGVGLVLFDSEYSQSGLCVWKVEFFLSFFAFIFCFFFLRLFKMYGLVLGQSQDVGFRKRDRRRCSYEAVAWQFCYFRLSDVNVSVIWW